MDEEENIILGQVIKNSISMGDQVDITNIDLGSPTIIDILNKIDKRNKDIVSSDVNTRRRVKARRRLISKSSSDNTVDQNEFLFSVDGKIGLPYSSSRTAKYKANNKIIESVLNIGTHKKSLSFKMRFILPSFI